MTSLVEIEAAIKNLSENEIRHLSEWIQTYLAEQWDQQLEMDFNTGKLDQLIAKAEADITNNQVKDLHAVLRNL
ncbi:hypothetical protein FEK30_08200 [Picosynechococcus sp. PCC 11901]|uniref:hypothetical protein n=1 Tax=Picosynechococcus sp. PCC 11901 TaxID=2579791 RepID=UPI0010FBF96E|nr:hypothetical protein [Picosynechococcus sp. PCC 11901]QCS49422.1 hypothetical protein FEK30_08200 [Picosynechococcus sp. PCC 11901]